MRVELRPYQAEALDRIAAAEARGVRRQMVVMATGLGKTVVFSALAARRGGRTLVLAHRDELISQAAAKVAEVWPEAQVGTVKGSDNHVHSQVVVASVQTLARANRLARLVDAQDDLAQAGPFDLVVVDEAHHAAADSYRRIIDGLGAGAAGGPLLLGVTATPDRGDGKGLDDLFDEVVAQADIQWGIRAGYLADVHGKRITVDGLNMGAVKVNRGDYDQGQAGALMEQAGAPQLIVDAWLEHAADRRTLVFTPTVAMAEHVAAAYVMAGVRAAYVHGGTPLDERRQLLQQYHRGDVQVLANCAVLTEGFDEPRTDCIVVARPTRSRALYAQMVGRGTRRHPEKADCLVLDVVGATTEHTLVTVPSLFGLDKKRAERMERGEGAGGLAQEQHDEDVRLGKLHAEDADLFATVRAEGIAWVALHRPGEPARYTRPLGKDPDGFALPDVVLAQRPDTEDWSTWLRYTDGTVRTLLVDAPQQMAQGVAEDYVRKHAAADYLVRADAPWRARKPTGRQLDAARRWRLQVDPRWTSGELSDHMEAHVARVKARRQERKAKEANR